VELRPRDNNHFGFDVADGAGAIVAPQYPNTGWLNRAATSWTETGLTPNTQYTRKVRAWNGTLNGAYSTTAQTYTLAVAPTAGTITPSVSALCVGENVTWTANGFGAAKVQYYKYAWDTSPTHAFTGSEPNWSSGTVATTPASAGTWYLHVQGTTVRTPPAAATTMRSRPGRSRRLPSSRRPDGVCRQHGSAQRRRHRRIRVDLPVAAQRSGLSDGG